MGGLLALPSVGSKEVNKEQPSYINLSATATRVLHSVHAQLQLLGNIFQLFTPPLHLT